MEMSGAFCLTGEHFVGVLGMLPLQLPHGCGFLAVADAAGSVVGDELLASCCGGNSLSLLGPR